MNNSCLKIAPVVVSRKLLVDDVGKPVAGWAPYFRDFHWKRSLLWGYVAPKDLPR